MMRRSSLQTHAGRAEKLQLFACGRSTILQFVRRTAAEHFRANIKKLYQEPPNQAMEQLHELYHRSLIIAYGRWLRSIGQETLANDEESFGFFLFQIDPEHQAYAELARELTAGRSFAAEVAAANGNRMRIRAILIGAKSAK